MVLKTLAFDVGTYGYVKHYYATYHSLMLVEVWLLVISAIKVTAMLPDYFLQEINYLFYVFFCNSLTTLWLSFVLHLRCQIIQDAPVEKARRFKILFVVKMLLLVMLVSVGPFIEYAVRNSNSFYPFLM